MPSLKTNESSDDPDDTAGGIDGFEASWSFLLSDMSFLARLCIVCSCLYAKSMYVADLLWLLSSIPVNQTAWVLAKV